MKPRLELLSILVAPALAAPSAAQAPFVAPSWPVTVTGNSVGGGLLIQADADPALEFCVLSGSATLGSQAHLFNIDGTSVPGWPVSFPEGVFAAPAAGDLDGDGEPEIVFTSFFFGIAGDLYAFHLDGSPVAGFPTTLGGPLKGAALGDLDGDGADEIVCGFNSAGVGRLGAFDGDGSFLPGWPIQLDTIVGTAPAIGDTDGDGEPEVYFASFEQLFAFDADGTLRPGFPFDPGAQFFNYNTPTLADLDGDGDREIVIASSAEFVDSPGRVWALEHTGQVRTGWPRATSSAIWAPPAVADLDGDGALDVILGDQLLSPVPVNSMYAFDGNGVPLPGFPVSGLDAVTQQVNVVDVDGDGLPEIVYETNVAGQGYQALNHDGTPVAGWPLAITGSSFNQMLSFADLDGDGFLDVAGTSDRVNDAETDVYLWSTFVPVTGDTIDVATGSYGPSRDGHLGKDTQPILREVGCGVNPDGSLVVEIGLPVIGGSFTLGVDNPLGTQAPPLVATLALSPVGAGSPCGPILPGLGQPGPYGPGEALLGPGFLFPFGVQTWTGPGTPALFPIAVPDKVTLVGASLFFQGLVIDPLAGAGLTRGIEAVIGS